MTQNRIAMTFQPDRLERIDGSLAALEADLDLLIALTVEERQDLVKMGHKSRAFCATALSVADAVEIAQTCTLAGRTDLIAGFLEAQSSPAKVRSQLLAAQAEASPEITSRIAPDAARPVASNPLIDAAKQIAAQSSKKEI